jgi:hypothetical protein
MYTWRTRLALFATLATGCTGEITAPGTGPGSGPNGNGSGANGSGANGSGANGSGANGSGASAGVGGGGGGGNVGTDPTVCQPGVPATSQLPRLTRTQYDNTIRDLVGIESQPSSMLAPDTTGSVDQRAWDGYKAAADAISQQVMANPTSRARAIPCTPSGDGAACAQQMIETFGRRVFRRPLLAEEVTRFMTLYSRRAEVTMGGTFDEAAQLIIRSFLLSPSFIVRGETGGTADANNRIALDPYQVATRLSYMLWSSTPDDALLDAAATNQLGTPELLLAQAQRMLADTKARGMVRSFHETYAHMGALTRWDAIQRDATLYPAFNEAMVPLLSEETHRFFDHVVFDASGSFQDLVTSPVGFVNATLAPLYGLPAASYGAELTRVDLDPVQRPGVFTRAGFLTAYSLFNRPSAILRGAFLQKDVLCTTIGTPPPDAEGTPLPTAGLATNRERTDAQTAAAECAGCHHGLINPTGFAMESFDAIGMWQTAEKDTAAPINTAATVPVGATTVDVAGAADLMTAIAASPEAKRCYAQKWVAFAYERMPNSADACLVDNMKDRLTQGGYTILNLIADLTQSESFRVRVQEL